MGRHHAILRTPYSVDSYSLGSRIDRGLSADIERSGLVRIADSGY